jgi:hypothetical protein
MCMKINVAALSTAPFLIHRKAQSNNILIISKFLKAISVWHFRYRLGGLASLWIQRVRAWLILHGSKVCEEPFSLDKTSLLSGSEYSLTECYSEKARMRLTDSRLEYSRSYVTPFADIACETRTSPVSRLPPSVRHQHIAPEDSYPDIPP